jgi:hypothetical protein
VWCDEARALKFSAHSAFHLCGHTRSTTTTHSDFQSHWTQVVQFNGVTKHEGVDAVRIRTMAVPVRTPCHVLLPFENRIHLINWWNFRDQAASSNFGQNWGCVASTWLALEPSANTTRSHLCCPKLQRRSQHRCLHRYGQPDPFAATVVVLAYSTGTKRCCEHCIDQHTAPRISIAKHHFLLFGGIECRARLEVGSLRPAFEPFHAMDIVKHLMAGELYQYRKYDFRNAFVCLITSVNQCAWGR